MPAVTEVLLVIFSLLLMVVGLAAVIVISLATWRFIKAHEAMAQALDRIADSLETKT